LGIKPRNREQHFGFDALLDDRIKLVTLMGKAGTGKTLLAMAAGLKRTVMDREFRRLVVARPTISMGKELGFLPGSLEESLRPGCSRFMTRSKCSVTSNMATASSQWRPDALG